MEAVVVVLEATGDMDTAWIHTDMVVMAMRDMVMGHPWVMVDMVEVWDTEVVQEVELLVLVVK